MSNKIQPDNGTLKAIVYRLRSTPTKNIPSIIPSVSKQILDCGNTISGASRFTIDAPDHPNLQKLKALITAFLNDKAAGKRWAATVLIKTLLDVGGPPVLQSCNPWAQGLLAMLKRKGPSITKKFAILTLTRIFTLTRDHQTLTREITTPALPQFVAQALQIAFPKTNEARAMPKDLLITVLESFCLLLPNHPTIFRGFLSQLQEGLHSVIFKDSLASSNGQLRWPCSKRVEVGHLLFAIISITAPKDKHSDEWARIVSNLIIESHSVADGIFRGILEDWQPTAGYARSGKVLPTEGEPHQHSETPLQLSPWSGMDAGCERLICLLDVLRAFVSSRTAAPVSVPLGSLGDLLARLLSTTVPSSESQLSNQRQNQQVSRDERDALWSNLPEVHIHALELAGALIDRFGKTLLSVSTSLREGIDWVCERESFNVTVREQSYLVMAKLIELFGSGFSESRSKHLTRLIKRCCQDINCRSGSESSDNGLHLSSLANGSVLNTPRLEASSSVRSGSAIRKCAAALLSTYLLEIPAGHIPQSVRVQVDRVSILGEDHQAMVASVLNTPTSTSSDRVRSSILPFLARSYPTSSEVEALVRPRMPIIPVNDISTQLMSKTSQSLIGVEGELDNDEGNGAFATTGHSDELANVQESHVTSTASLAYCDEAEESPEPSTHRKRDNPFTRSLSPFIMKRAKHTNPLDSQQANNEYDTDVEPYSTVQDKGDDQRVSQGETSDVSEMSFSTETGRKLNINAPRPATSLRDGDGDSDDDFEMPPLTLASDSDEDE